MRLDFSKEFAKEARKLSGKMLKSFLHVMDEVRAAESVEQLTDCKKLVGYQHIYRIRIGSKRAFFSFHVEIVDGIARFFYLDNRGSAYDKEAEKTMKREDQ